MLSEAVIIAPLQWCLWHGSHFFSLVWFLLAGEWEVLEGESLVGAQALFV